GTSRQIFYEKKHPYTEGLQRSIPRLDTDVNSELYTIEGTVPSLNEMPTGCRFANRCSFCTEKCISSVPNLYEADGGRKVRCFRCCENSN
ncbi:MAG: oligopeptide/dipeptide ABC transporter ATP-binding protein, partial [Oscillospiraceae bacterium]